MNSSSSRPTKGKNYFQRPIEMLTIFYQVCIIPNPIKLVCEVNFFQVSIVLVGRLPTLGPTE